jgi:hypothetical protein
MRLEKITLGAGLKEKGNKGRKDERDSCLVVSLVSLEVLQHMVHTFTPAQHTAITVL